MKYLEELIESATKALRSLPIREQVITDLGDIKSLDISRGVYIIEEINGDTLKTSKDFLDHKFKQYVAMPRVNIPNKILYVGSSRKDLKNRLLQHAGYGHPSTYALHLKDWFSGELKITVKEYDVSDQILQLIEDAIAHDLQPSFGKRGPL